MTTSFCIRAATIAAALTACLRMFGGDDGGVEIRRENLFVVDSPTMYPLVFETFEVPLNFINAAAALNTLPDTQIHDAYDADRDGVYARVDVTFSKGGESMTVPAFPMRETPNGPWAWRVRWSPRSQGRWTMKIDVDARISAEAKPLRFSETFKDFVDAGEPRGIQGPLIVPGPNDDPRFVRRLKLDGSSEALWLFGVCRAWSVDDRNDKTTWAPNEWIDREKDLFPVLRESGYNLLNQWMAPWEFGLVHHDRAERWRRRDGSWDRIPLPENAAWSAYQCFDQGRASAFDTLVRSSEGSFAADGHKKIPTIHLLLSPLPHQGLQMKEHPWGGNESGWSPGNDGGKQGLERLNGFSAFKPNMTAWDFFAADPSLPLDDWRSKLFDHQANFYRYVIARWGASRAVGAWVIIDELDAVGDVAGSMKDKTGWWGHPQCDAWLGNIFRLFRGELKRSDGLRYASDAFHHPLTSATTSLSGQAERGANLDWPGPRNARPDIFGWHWYPSWKPDANWGDVFAYTASGPASYAKAPLGETPRLIGEFGAPNRNAPGDTPSALYPTLYHVAIWSAIFSGHAGTPMDWNDGKEFGEMRWRNRPGIFDKEHYPIDNTAQLVALKKFLGDMKPDEWESKRIVCESANPGVQACALHTKSAPDRIAGWLFSTLREGPFSIKGLSPGNYELTWYDPWTGETIPNVAALNFSVKENEVIKVDALPAFKALRAGLPAFPTKSREAKGHDAAFKIEKK